MLGTDGRLKKSIPARLKRRVARAVEAPAPANGPSRTELKEGVLRCITPDVGKFQQEMR
jgi:hypothetical protein